MGQLAKAKNEKKSPSSGARSAFDRHMKAINKLQEKIKASQQEHEDALFYYASEMQPKEKELADLITQFLVKICPLRSKPKAFTAKEKESLDDLLRGDIQVLMNLQMPGAFHEEVKMLHEELFGTSIDQMFDEELSLLQEELEEYGFDDLDLSDIRSGDSAQDVLQKFVEAAAKMAEAQEESEEPPAKAKTKKELLKEEKARQLEKLQNQGLGAIYKRLAKELHPDLEQDLQRRMEKELLMKRLTVAYEKRDLLALLELESEWMGSIDRDMENLTDDTLKIYNSILKDQTEELKSQLDLVSMNPRYMEFIRHIPEEPFKAGKIKKVLSEAQDDLVEMMNDYSVRIKDISGKNAIQIIKQRLGRIENPMELLLKQLFAM
jgi:hypothetical protein